MKFLYILLALVILLVLITVHELGHFVAGKVFGFKINEFAIGFGPKLYSRTNKKTGEVFSIRALPLGGFCAFEGEDDENPSKDAFNNKAPWKRIIVLVSGVLFNFIFGIITATIFLMVNGYAVPLITDFSPNNANAGLLMAGDRIVAVDGKSVEIYRSASDMLKKVKAGEEITITVERPREVISGEGADVSKTIVYDTIKIKGVKKIRTEAFFFASQIGAAKDKVFKASMENPEIKVAVSEEELYNYIKSVQPKLKDKTEANAKDEYEEFTLGEQKYYKANGAAYTDKEIVDLVKVVLSSPTDSIGYIFTNAQARYGFFECFLKAWPFCFYMCGLILSALGGLFTGATALKDVGGTVTAISQIADISSQSIQSVLLLLPMLAMNLALFNILPIPALDGAGCVFVLIEWIFRKPIPRRIQNIINTVGLFVLLGLVVFLDVYHFFIAPKAAAAIFKYINFL